MNNETPEKTSLQVEQGFLSAIMIAEAEFVEWARDVVNPEDFAIPGHDLIYQAALVAHDATGGKDRSPSMIVSQAAKLRVDNGKWKSDSVVLASLEELNCGFDYLENIRKVWVGEESGREYGLYIADKADRRRLKEAGSTIFSLAESDDPDYKTKAEHIFGEAVTPGSDANVMDGEEAIEIIQKGIRQESNVPIRSVLTGIEPIDVYGLGYVAGKYYLIAGPPHDGKTQIALASVFGAAYYSNALVIIFPYEQDWFELSCTVQSMFTGGNTPWLLDTPEISPRIPVHKKRVMELSQPRDQILEQYKQKRRMGYKHRFVQPTREELLELDNSAATMRTMGYKVVASPDSIGAMRATVRRIARRNPGRHIIAVLDYIQLASKGDDNYREINKISHGIKQSAMHDNPDKKNPVITWVALSQFNRGNGTNALMKNGVTWESSPRTVPLGLDALAESPALGQDPDFILYLLQNERHMSKMEKDALKIEDNDWVKLSYSIMKNRIGTEYNDGCVYINKRNGMVSHRDDLDLFSQYVEPEEEPEDDG